MSDPTSTPDTASGLAKISESHRESKRSEESVPLDKVSLFRWLEYSTLVQQMRKDFPGEILQFDEWRMFAFPKTLSEENINSVLDNIRYFDVTENLLLFKVFQYFITNSDSISHIQDRFPEFSHLWADILFLRENSSKYNLGAIDEDSSRNKHFAIQASSCGHIYSLQHSIDNLKVNCCGDICLRAADGGHLGCLMYAHENGCPWDKATCSKAASQDNLDCLKYAHENGCPWDEETCSHAAGSGSIDCLKYAHENGCPWDEKTCAHAAGSGSIDCLKYAHENGCPWDERITRVAAHAGRILCLKYAYENGCPWDETTCTAAAQGGHLECLMYAHENGCPWDEYTCIAARTAVEYIGADKESCLRYALRNGCPDNLHSD